MHVTIWQLLRKMIPAIEKRFCSGESQNQSEIEGEESQSEHKF